MQKGLHLNMPISAKSLIPFFLPQVDKSIISTIGLGNLKVFGSLGIQ